ncbi:TetR/AcrR family transcriptional regulator [Curtobacterium sp. ZW137]|uniref:TetR/AcrR family transcriptional regulator n=1 Tax=Curtobacterium sp. ZW137 TaxID=2485104 RepID=UPI000F4AFF40|nr:TetR/AcrR family transcriptional regulator [Curtobacterium sp. ZW137]ROP63909.1 TetR family transcriptional regulator [Curtobacterium sp. ZW137]
MTGPRSRGRQTSAEIEHDLLDIAAGLIARRGIKDTAVQAVADQAGYSKAAVLARFTSKDALVGAAVRRCIEQTEAIRDAVARSAVGPERDAAALAAVTDLALARPGWAEFALAGLALRRGDDVSERLEPMAAALLGMFGIDMADPAAVTLDRRARVTGAFGALIVLSLTYENDASAAEARPVLLDVGWSALGHTGSYPGR